MLETRKFKEISKKQAFLQKEEIKQRNKSLIITIKNSEKRVLTQKNKLKTEKNLKNSQELQEKLDFESLTIEEQEKQLLYLEEKEKNLMEKLKNTQKHQKQAYEDFSFEIKKIN